MSFQIGDKVRVGKGKTVWVIVSFNQFTNVAQITTGKRTTREWFSSLTKVEE